MGWVWAGVIEIGLGLVFCFLGHSAARVVLGFWGAIVGYFAGEVLYLALNQWLGGGWIALIPDWVFAVLMALLLAWLSFAFYAMGVLISMGALGWVLGQGISQAMHLPPWLTFSLSLVIAAGLVMAGWTMNLPRLLLILLTAVVGAGAIIDGVQVLMGGRQPWTDDAYWRLQANSAFLWTGAFLVVLVAGIIVQSRQQAEGNLRSAYDKG
jgi:hypothetical protein